MHKYLLYLIFIALLPNVSLQAADVQSIEKKVSPQVITNPFSLEGCVLANIVKNIKSCLLSDTGKLEDARISQELKQRLEPLFDILESYQLFSASWYKGWNDPIYRDTPLIEALLVIVDNEQRKNLLNDCNLISGAIIGDHNKAVELLLDLGIHPKNGARNFEMLLMWAIGTNSYPIVKLLLDRNPDKNAFIAVLKENLLILAQKNLAKATTEDKKDSYGAIIDLLLNYKSVPAQKSN